MIEYAQALKKIEENVSALPVEQVRIEDAVGRVAGEDVSSGIEMPPFDKSAMDGYALKSSDLQNVPGKLRCIGLIQAGDIFNKKLQRNDCVKIMTGAPLPAGADSVIMVEDTLPCGNFVKILKTVKKGGNVCRRGEDLKRGQKVLARGGVISSSHIAVLAAVGRSFVKARALPKISILNTGGEIVPAGAKLGRNKIYNSNGPMLEALLKSDNIKPVSLGIAEDNLKDLKGAIKEGLNSDMLLISGGVSMGDYDLVPGVLNNLGVKRIFHKVNIKPGKPLFFGRKGKTIVFGIPGNPVSNFLAYWIFIRPAVDKMRGYKFCGSLFKEGLSQKEFSSNVGRKHFVLAKAEEKEGKYYLTALPGHGSADILALARADGFMVVDKNLKVIRKNEKVGFITWKIK